ncbi:hypothetical protein LINGRAPRIM_LOCUS2887 [Linum grandiflorum]
MEGNPIWSLGMMYAGLKIKADLDYGERRSLMMPISSNLDGLWFLSLVCFGYAY